MHMIYFALFGGPARVYTLTAPMDQHTYAGVKWRANECLWIVPGTDDDGNVWWAPSEVI